MYLQHYCDEVTQGINQATADAAMLHNSVARLAAQCQPHELSPPPAAAAIAPATAQAIETVATKTPEGSPALTNVVAYGDHSAGNIHASGRRQVKPQLVSAPSQN